MTKSSLEDQLSNLDIITAHISQAYAYCGKFFVLKKQSYVILLRFPQSVAHAVKTI